jgi:exodeoxyribonuclease III
VRIATFNINDVNKRLDNLLAWLAETEPDVVCLQELKAEQGAFPAETLAQLGYQAAWRGQRTWNGVAILARGAEPVVTRRALPGDAADAQARYIEAAVGGVVVASIYLPNGNPIGTDKFAYKLRWMARLTAHARELLAYEEPLALMGDYNVIPEPRDAAHPENWTDDALFQTESREAFRTLKWIGLTEAYLAADGAPDAYTFWDYQAGAWQRNNGIRIDHALLSPQAADLLRGCEIHRHARGWDKPSDHVPLVIELDL